MLPASFIKLQRVSAVSAADDDHIVDAGRKLRCLFLPLRGGIADGVVHRDPWETLPDLFAQQLEILGREGGLRHQKGAVRVLGKIIDFFFPAQYIDLAMAPAGCSDYLRMRGIADQDDRGAVLAELADCLMQVSHKGACAVNNPGCALPCFFLQSRGYAVAS